MGELMVLVEHRSGTVREITFEMLELARRIASERGLTVTALLLGHGLSELAAPMESACDNLIVMNDPVLADYNADPYLLALEAVIDERRPVLTLVGHTAAGMDLAPAAAARVGLPLVTDCSGVELDEGGLRVVRQEYGGKIEARLTMKPADRCLVTVRPGSFPGLRERGRSTCTAEVPAPAWEGLRGRRFLEYLETVVQDVDIASADVLVSVGRGIGKPENIPQAQALADALGATLSCSRPVADKEWLPRSRQVGTSGKTVRPKVYIALGISGAFQHQAGMNRSDTIIAVNKDPGAPIFNVAHYGIVADLLEVLPVLTTLFRG